MKVQFYFDPSCPFCWITSRWLLIVEGERDLTIEWRPFSLALKNGELKPASQDQARTGGNHGKAHRAIRMLMAANEQHGTPLTDLYTAFGNQFHLLGHDYTDETIAQVLKELALPTSLVQAADQTVYDQQIATSMKQATDVAGDDIGVPAIVFPVEDGSSAGYFGPVLYTLPSQTEALKIWDGLSQLATNSSFYELKRERPAGRPDTASTARC